MEVEEEEEVEEEKRQNPQKSGVYFLSDWLYEKSGEGERIGDADSIELTFSVFEDVACAKFNKASPSSFSERAGSASSAMLNPAISDTLFSAFAASAIELAEPE